MEEFKKFEEKYFVQMKILNLISKKELDTNTLHSLLEAMLVNTANDCIKLELGQDIQTQIIVPLENKKNKSKFEQNKLFNGKSNLISILDYQEICENSFHKIISRIFEVDKFKEILKNDIPELYEEIYYLADLEEIIIDTAFTKIVESYELLDYKDICKIINEEIIITIIEAEEINEEIKEYELYDSFKKAREKRYKNYYNKGE